MAEEQLQIQALIDGQKYPKDAPDCPEDHSLESNEAQPKSDNFFQYDANQFTQNGKRIGAEKELLHIDKTSKFNFFVTNKNVWALFLKFIILSWSFNVFVPYLLGVSRIFARSWE